MIIIKNLVPDTLTNTSGVILYYSLKTLLQSHTNTILLSFEGIPSTSSSFLNSSIGTLIDEYGIDILKRIKPVKVGVIQSQVLKKYIASVAKIAKN